MDRLTVLGASARALAQSAKRAGFAPYAIDLFADRDLAACCEAVRIERYPSGFIQALEIAPCGPWMYTGGLENYPRLVERLARIRPLLGNGGEVLRKVRLPENIQAAAVTAGCRFPRVGDQCAGLALLKRRRGSGGIAVRFASPAERLQVPRGSYLQEHVEGASASAIYVASGERALLLGATRQLVGRDFELALPFVYVGSIGPLSLDESMAAKLQCLGDVIAGRFQLSGLFNVDFVLKGGDVWVLEVNPRYSASVEILERAMHDSFVRLHVDACLSGALPPLAPPTGDTYFGKAVVYADADSHVPAALDKLPQGWSDEGGLADIPGVGERIAALQPVVTVLADGKTVEAVETELRRRVADVRGLLGDFSVGTARPTG